jgi:hypothetical protein
VVASFVGLLTKKATLLAAVIAVLPISILASGFALRGAWISLLLALCAILLAGFSQRLVQDTRTTASATKSDLRNHTE